MKGYLLDNNAVFRWHGGHPRITSRIAGLPSGALLKVSAVTLGEIRFGYEKNPPTDQEKRDDFERWFCQQFQNPLPITRHTATYYGDIRAQLFKMYPPPGRHENHPEMCCDKVTAKSLGIDENDLWLAAQSLEHNLVLVTNDRMRHIRTACGKLLDLEDWEQ